MNRVLKLNFSQKGSTLFVERSHFDEVQSFIYDNGIHILALNETKLPPEYPKELTKIEGYQQTRLDRTSSGGGVALYIKDKIYMAR